MTAIQTDDPAGLSRQRAAIRATSQRLVSLLETVKDPTATAIGEWSIQELAIHLTEVFESYPRLFRGDGAILPAPSDITRHNAEVVEAGQGLSVKDAARRIGAAVSELDGLLAQGSPSEPITWHGGLRLSPATFAAIPASEAIVHGHDVAGAEGRSVKTERPHAGVTLANLVYLLPNYVNKEAAAGFDAVYDIRLKSGERRFLSFRDGSLEVGTTGGKADCVVLADPETFLLVGYNRIGQWKPAFTGKVLTWGRKPWLALKIPKLIQTI